MNKLAGTIKIINEVETVERANNMEKRTFIIETEEQYPQTLEIETIKHGVQELIGLQAGDRVIVDIEIRGRQWTNPDNITKYFMSLQTWKIHKADDIETEIPKEPEGYEADVASGN